MPKSISKTKMSKKKKFNSRFPPARIKKIMQTDEDVGKVAATVPIIISRALEMFIESLIKETSQTTIAKNAKTLSTSHIKQTIYSNKQYNFLRALVANMPDHNTEDNTGKANGNSTCDTTQGNGDIPPKKKRGRPPKVRETPAFDKRKQGHSSKVSPKTSDEDDDEDEDDETESEDEVQPPKPPAASSNHTTTSLPSPSTSSFSYTATENKSGTGITLVNTALPQSYPPLLPPGYSVPAPASLVKQQQQLQVHQQMMMSQQQIPQQQQQQQQQQLVMGSAPPSVLQHPPYLPPTPLTTPNPSPLTNLIPQGSVDGYQLPPQLPHNPYYTQAVPMMPLAHQLPLHPGVSGYQQGMGHHMPAPQTLAFAPQTQAQPINLSLSSSQGQPLPRDQAENYDS